MAHPGDVIRSLDTNKQIVVVSWGFTVCDLITISGNLNPIPSVSPLFVIQLQPNLARWYSGTKSLKSHKNFADLITRR